MFRPLSVLACVVALAACSSPRYVYSPTVVTAAEVGGLGAARYVIPKDAPAGELRVYSLGIVEARDRSGATIPAVHVRLVVRNGGREAWVVDGKEQRLELDPSKEPRLLHATTADSAPAPFVTIPAGTERLVDLFFPMPENRRATADLVSFDALVVVRAGSAVVTERVEFERFRVVPPVSTDLNGNRYPSRMRPPR